MRPRGTRPRPSPAGPRKPFPWGAQAIVEGLFTSRSVQAESQTGVAFDQPEEQVVAPSPVDLEEASRVTLAPEAVALKQGDRRRIFRDAGRFDPMQAQLW